MMYEEAITENGNTQRLKLVSFIRVVVYLFVITSQVYYLWEVDPSLATIDPMIIMVPLVLAILDGAVLFWSERDTQKFLNVTPFASILAILVGVNSVWITITLNRWHMPHFDLFVFSLGVILVSVWGMMQWIEKNEKAMKRQEEKHTVELRTYDS